MAVFEFIEAWCKPPPPSFVARVPLARRLREDVPRHAGSGHSDGRAVRRYTVHRNGATPLVDTLRREQRGVHDAEDTTTVSSAVPEGDGGACTCWTSAARAGAGARAGVRDDPHLGAANDGCVSGLALRPRAVMKKKRSRTYNEPAFASRDLTLDFLRGVAMLYIVGIWHLDDYTRALDFDNSVTQLLTVSFLGLFFFLSGMLLSGRYGIRHLRDAGHFYVRRFRRIYPMYVLAPDVGSRWTWFPSRSFLSTIDVLEEPPIPQCSHWSAAKPVPLVRGGHLPFLPRGPLASLSS